MVNQSAMLIAEEPVYSNDQFSLTKEEIFGQDEQVDFLEEPMSESATVNRGQLLSENSQLIFSSLGTLEHNTPQQ